MGDGIHEQHDNMMAEYRGLTTDELLALEGKRDSRKLVFAFDEALAHKFARAMGQPYWESQTFEEAVQDVAEGRPVRGPLTEEELIVLAILALYLEVNNGGYEQMFHNRGYQAAMLVKALHRIGRDDVAAVTQEAIDALNVQGPLRDDGPIDDALEALTDERGDKLGECDDRFYAIATHTRNKDAEHILDVSLWNFIKANRDKIRVP